MIQRALAKKLRQLATTFPVITLTGPRQSGKTTLVQHVFPRHAYVSLEQPTHRRFALDDPRGFLAQFTRPVILDEAQYAPDLFSYIQGIVDARDQPGQFILTGSQNFLLLQRISQSLAGRCAILHLLPCSLAELSGRPPVSLKRLGREHARHAVPPPRSLMECLFMGGYPRIHDKHLDPRDWLASYYQTYLERDVRNVLAVGDLEQFSRFVLLCAGRNGQLLNLSSLASDCGATHTTARRWLSVLEASFLIALLRPYHRNFGKRLVKSPKLYFLDTGLLCYLLQIDTAQALYQHAARGAIFEAFVLSELYKNFMNRGQRPWLYFWRDVAGHEVDFLIEQGTDLLPIEVKSSETLSDESFRELLNWRAISSHRGGPLALIYAGSETTLRKNVRVYPWFTL